MSFPYTEGVLMQISFIPLGGHPWGILGCQKKQKIVRNSNLLNWFSTFQSELNKLWKTTRNKQTTFKNYEFLVVFWSSFNFDWKVEHWTKKFEFHELFCFFWDPWCLQGFTPSGGTTYFTFLFEILWWWRHLPSFHFIENEDYGHLVCLSVELIQVLYFSQPIWWLF